MENKRIPHWELKEMRLAFVQVCFMRGRIRTERDYEACLDYFNQRAEEKGWI